MVVLKNSALGLNFQFHDLAKNHTLFNGNVYPTKNFRHGLKNSTLITQAKCNSSPSGLRPSGLEFAFCFRDSGGIFQSITQIFVGFPHSQESEVDPGFFIHKKPSILNAKTTGPKCYDENGMAKLSLDRSLLE